MFRRLFKFLPSAKIAGYEHPDLVDAVLQKTLAYRPQQTWPEIGTPRTVLDFGGGCGIHYRQAQSPSVRWAVVETPAMVLRAKMLETDQLKFFTDIGDASKWLGAIDVMHSNGAIQYAPEPARVLAALCTLGAQRMLWYRMFLSEQGSSKEEQTSRLQDNGPNTVRVKRASLTVERTSISETDFLSAHLGYALQQRGADWFIFAKGFQ